MYKAVVLVVVRSFQNGDTFPMALTILLWELDLIPLGDKRVVGLALKQQQTQRDEGESFGMLLFS